MKAGGRTGLTGVTVAVLFLLTLFFAPLAGSVPAYATAPALLFVACLMARGFAAPREPVRVTKLTKLAILFRYALI